MTQLGSLTYGDPKKGVWLSMARSAMHDLLADGRHRRPRRPESKSELEYRQAALFGFARASIANDADLKFAMVPAEADSADAVLRTGSSEGCFKYERVQLKEVVPETVNPRQELNGLLEAVSRRYCTGEEITVAINLNRDLITKLGAIPAPNLPAVTFWLFGLCGRNRGFLVSDPFKAFTVYEFSIPNPPSSMTDW